MTSVIRPLLLLTAVVLGGATVSVALVPGLSFGFESPTTHVAVETASAVIALLAASILLGRLRERRAAGELLLFAGFSVLVIGNVARAFVPSFDGGNPEVVWVPLIGTTFAAAVLAAAPFVRRADLTPRAQLISIGLLLGGAVATMLAAWLLADDLSTGLDPGISPSESFHPRVIGSPGMLALQLVGMGLFAVSAVGFALRSERSGDQLLAWFAIAMTLAALTRLNYFLFPSTYSDWVFTGDFLRLATYLVILAGALHEIAVYQRTAARAAVLEERARIARDLHDGLAQDLAYVSMQGLLLTRRYPEVEGLARVAQDAVARSREAIENLRIADGPLSSAVGEVAGGLAERHEAALELELDEEADIRPELRSEVLFVLREAISNAARHGGARTIYVRLRRREDAAVELAIADDGRGFDVAAASEDPEAGFGLASMRGRVQRLGGDLEIRSERGRGTSVTVVIP